MSRGRSSGVGSLYHGRELEQAAQFRPLLVKSHVMSAQGRDPRRLHTARPTADDENLLPFVRFFYGVVRGAQKAVHPATAGSQAIDTGGTRRDIIEAASASLFT